MPAQLAPNAHRAGVAVSPGRDPRFQVRAASGRAADELTVEELLAGALGDADIRISAEQLRVQAAAAHRSNHPQLADNLTRAAELTLLHDDDVLALYEALRPGRSSTEDLNAWAGRLDALPAPTCAALVREALGAYRSRGLLS
jgi:propanediol dehydratase small subunit